MKKKLLTFIFFSIFTTVTIFAQNIEIEELYAPTTSSINRISFINERDGWLITNSGLVKSTNDSGKTWIDKGNLYDYFLFFLGDGYYQIDQPNDIHFTNSSIGFIVSRFGIFKTTDAGLTWTVKYYNQDLNKNLNEINIKGSVGLVPVKTCNLGATGDTNCNRYYLKSTDYGENWAVVSTNNYPSDYLSIEMKSEQEYYASTYAYPSAIGINYSKTIRKTIDGGNTWTSIPKFRSFENSISDISISGDSLLVSGQRSYIDTQNGLLSEMKYKESSFESSIEIKEIERFNGDILFGLGNVTSFPTNVSTGLNSIILISKDKGLTWQKLSSQEFNNIPNKDFKKLNKKGNRVWLVSNDNKLYSFKYIDRRPPDCQSNLTVVNNTKYIVNGEDVNILLNYAGALPAEILVNNSMLQLPTSQKSLIFKPTTDTTLNFTRISNICGLKDINQNTTIKVYPTCSTPAVSISGGTSINPGQGAILTIDVNGLPPLSLKVNNVQYENVVGLFRIPVFPSLTTTYTVSDVSNRCGLGTASGSAIITVVQPCFPPTNSGVSGNQAINLGDSASVVFNLAGSGPWNINFGGQIYDNITNSPFILKLRPKETRTYYFYSVTNNCGTNYPNVPITISLNQACKTPTIQVSGEQLINKGDSSLITVLFDGVLPWSLNINDQFFSDIKTTDFKTKLAPTSHTLYYFSNITDFCGINYNSVGLNINVTCEKPIFRSISGNRGINPTLSLENCDGGVRWYNNLTDIGSFHSGNTLNQGPVNQDRLYYVDCTLLGCFTSPKLPYEVKIFNDNCPELLDFGKTSQFAGNYASKNYLISSAKINATTNYTAGKSLQINPGFIAEEGVLFKAEIKNCESNEIILPQGLVAYFNFNNSNYLDLSGNQNNGSFFSGSFSADRRQNANSKSILFDQYGSWFKYLRVPNSPSMSLNNAYTFAFWAKGGDYFNWGQAFFSKDGIRNNRPYYEGVPFDGLVFQPYSIYNGSGYQDAFKLSVDMSSQYFPISNGLYDKTQWNYFVVSYKNGLNSIYVNGQLMSSFTKVFNLTYANTRDLIIGGALGIGQYGQYIPEQMFNGSIDDFRMYNRALSDIEVTTLFNAEK